MEEIFGSSDKAQTLIDGELDNILPVKNITSSN